LTFSNVKEEEIKLMTCASATWVLVAGAHYFVWWLRMRRRDFFCFPAMDWHWQRHQQPHPTTNQNFNHTKNFLLSCCLFQLMNNRWNWIWRNDGNLLWIQKIKSK
jgi:hypothetical protein